MYVFGTEIMAFCMIDDDDQLGSDPAPGVTGEAWITKGWSTKADGLIVIYNGATWDTIAALAEGMAVVVNGDGHGRASGSFAAFDGQLIRRSGATWVACGTNASMRIVMPRLDTVFTGQLWGWDAVSGWHRLLRDCDVMVDGVGTPNGTVDGFKGQTFLDGATGDIYINNNGGTGWVRIFEVPV